MTEYLDFITVDFWHIVMSMGNLLILTAIVKKFLFNPVNKIINKRQNEVDTFYLDAKKALSCAESDKNSYKKKINMADKEASKIINAAIKKADDVSQNMINDTNEKISILINKAQKDIEIKKRGAILEMKDEISEMVISLAEKVVKREITADTHSELINAAIDNLYEG